MSSDNPVIALAVADLHLTAEAPIARSGEPDWETVIKRQFDQLKQLSFEHGVVPILCAGDVFDKWNAPAEAINMALEHMPRMHAIPGQHDLPYHDLGQVHKTAFGVLVKAGKLDIVIGERTVGVPGWGCFKLYGFPWSVPVKGVPEDGKNLLRIAIIHAYCWHGAAKHQQASDKCEVSRYDVSGFDVAVFGDNHKSFDYTHGGCHVFNCGGFFRRKSDETNHRPRVGLIHADGSVETHYLDVSKDIFLAKTAKEMPRTEELLGVTEFVDSLSTVRKGSLNFTEALRVYHTTQKLSPVASALLKKLIDET